MSLHMTSLGSRIELHNPQQRLDAYVTTVIVIGYLLEPRGQLRMSLFLAKLGYDAAPLVPNAFEEEEGDDLPI